MKKWFCIVTILLFALPAFARHVAGGELFYEYLGPGPITDGTPTNIYRITLRLFRDCASTGPLLENEGVIVGIYSNSLLYVSLTLPIASPVTTISLNTNAF